MSFLTTSNFRPNRLKQKKDDAYHLEYAKWAASAGENKEYRDWLFKININKRFYKGDQWTTDEDIEAFLKDTSGQERNRIKVIHNVIRPMIEQFRGNAIRLSVNATAKSISPMANNRREAALSQRLLKTEIARALPEMGEILQKMDPTIGDTSEETTEIFNNLYVDEYVEKMNYLLDYVESLNELPKLKIRLAQNLALSGLSVVKCFNHGGHRRYSVVEPEDFIFDHDAREFDLSDASFMGTKTPMDPSDIFERFQDMKDSDRNILETQSSQDSNGYILSDPNTSRLHSNNRIPVYEMYWKDSEMYEYGWVKDEFGYENLVRINESENGERPKYTDEDLIDPPSTNRNKVLFKGRKKRRLSVDIIRYCAFVPRDYVPGNHNDKSDMILEWGVLDYQDTNYLDLSNVKFPFKCHTWGYIDGEIFSPVDDAINPQRFINRILSVFESQVNNSGGAGIVIDEDAIDPQDKEAIYSDISEGKPITVKTKGRGVPNTVGYYDATPKSGSLGILEIIPVMKNMIQETTGVNDALKGESIGNDQLVGVTQLLIQRGSLMQEPFYEAISQTLMQVYQDVASVGKRFYLDHERELAIAAGDDGVKVFKLSEDMRHEDFRVFITRDNDDEMLKNQANQILTMFMQSQLIDRTTFINLYGRSTPEKVLRSIRDNERLRIETERRSAEAESQAQAQQMEMQKVAALEQEAEMAEQQQLQNQAETERIAQQNQAEINKINAKAVGDMMKEDRKIAAENEQNNRFL